MGNITFKGLTVDAKRAITKEYPVTPRQKHYAARSITSNAFILEDENQTEQKKQIDIDYSAENDYFITTKKKSDEKANSKIIAKNFKSINDVIDYLKEATKIGCEAVKAEAQNKMAAIDNPRKRHAEYGKLSYIAASMDSIQKDMDFAYDNWQKVAK